MNKEMLVDERSLENGAVGLIGLIVILAFVGLIALKRSKDREKLFSKYSMEILWSEEDKAYIVTVPELPGCKTHGETYEDAVKQGKLAIEGWIEANLYWGRPIPSPRGLTPPRELTFA